MSWRTRVSLIVLAIALGPSALLSARQGSDATPKPPQGGPQSPQAGSQAQGPTQSAYHRQVSSTAVIMSSRHDVSRPLREIPATRLQGEGGPHEPFMIRQVKRPPHQPDPALQTSAPVSTAPGPLFNFEGVDNVDNVLPPDTNGDIGPNHYVQWVNLTFAIYSRSGSLLYGPAAGRTLWSGFGGPCEARNDGDPIVLYDHLADRWIMSQLALPNNFLGILFAPFYQCIAISQTPDPTGAYYRYQFEFSKLNDYPKLGVWPDGYYLTINQYAPITLTFAGQGVAAFDRAAMLAGQPARMIYFDLASVDPNLGGMLPADLDGPPPPPGSPNYFVEMDDDAAGYSPDQLQLWRFHADWTSPSASTFTGPFAMPVAAFDSSLCDHERDCIPQPGTSEKLDAMSDRLMYRLQYRNLGTHESLVVNHTVDVDGTDHAGVRWYEVRDPGGSPIVYQQGTYAPDTFHRWMGSAAMDAAGNIAVAFNLSGSTMAPSIRYAARLATDPPGLLSQGENDLIIGTGSQTHTSSRWGDYSMLGVDPVDGCTFWATAEYYAATTAAGWQTRIGAFRLPGCGSSGPPPNAPTNLGATTVSDTRVDLSWTDQSSDEMGFAVERCTGTVAACVTSGSFSQTGQTGSNNASFVDNALHGSTTYSYRVRAFNLNGNSGYSNIVEATTQAAPPPPTVTVSVIVPTATEAGTTKGIFRVDRGVSSSSALAVSLSLTGTAVNGVDYVTTTATATIPSGAAFVDVAITPIDDTLIEPDETVILTLRNGTGYVLGTPASGTVTIVSDDVQPDLVVSAFTAPATGGAGLPIQITDTTKNQGTGAAAASTTYFYLSKDFQLSAADPVVGTRAVPDLAVGATSTNMMSVTLPDPLEPGLYTLFAKADGGNVLSESQEANNVRQTAIRIGPDLLVTALTAPATAGAGTSVPVTETTTNQGGGPAAASSTRFYLSLNYSLDGSDSPLQSRAVSALGPSGSSNMTTTVTLPQNLQTGLYYLIANADDGASVAETSEINNTRYVTIRVGPDLTVSGISAPARAGAGEPILVTDTTKNSGSGNAGASATVFYLSVNNALDAGDFRLSPVRSVGALAAGESSTATTSLTVPAVSTGVWYLIANADDAREVAETQETNNTRYTTILIGPDLTVSLLTAPLTAAPGSTVVVTDTVKNSGTGTAPASVTRFYLSTNALFDASDVLLSGERSVPALAANTTNAGTTNVVLPPGLSGLYFIIAVADGPGAVAETNESNNALARGITIK
jgi:subtilase family serine protease